MGNNAQWCDAAWMNRAWGALCETLDVGGDTKRDMIEFLFDAGFWNRQTLTWDAAVSRFNDCLNPSKKVKFGLAEVWALTKQFERFQLLHTIAADTGHDIHRIPTAARMEQLMETIANGLDLVHKAQLELHRIGGGNATPVRLHPAIAERIGVFDKGNI